MTTKPEELLVEFEPLGKYRVRILKKEGGVPSIDIREYLSADRFEGFTRRGIRLTDAEQAEKLMSALAEYVGRLQEVAK